MSRARPQTAGSAGNRSTTTKLPERGEAQTPSPEVKRLFHTIREYIGFTEKDSALLASFFRHVEPHLDEIVDDFYGRIKRDPGAVKVIRGGAVQIERLKETLRTWLVRLLRGPHDERFALRQSLIGRRHVMVGLDQAYMITGMYVFREHLNRILLKAYPGKGSRAGAVHGAFTRALDMSLALVLETYREEYVARILRAEQNAARRRLAALGEVASSIAHEIRNPLAGISGAIQILSDQTALSDPKREILDRIGAEIRRLDAKISEMLVYARPPTLRVEPAHPRDLLKLALEIVAGHPLLKGTRIIVRAAGSLPQIQVDSAQIQQVLLNLILNAAQAMNGTGKILLEAREAGGGRIEFAVEDTGPGVADEIAPKVFKPFFTTRKDGTGLGLAISSKIVESHGGRMDLRRSRSGSARFVFYLPVEPLGE